MRVADSFRVLILLGLAVATVRAQQPLILDLPPRADESLTRDEERAAKLFQAAQEAAAAKQAARAYQLLYQSLRQNPDFAQVRRLLGYARYREGWHTPFEVRQLGSGKQWHDKFGWLPEDHIARYEKGERYYRGRWMSVEAEAKLRSSIEQGWRIESDHFAVQTNDSLETGVELSQRLERLYCVWQQLFAGYLIDDVELARRFAGKAPRSTGIRQHQVTYFRSRDEYNQALKSQQPKIEMTLGIYFDNLRQAFFFAGKDQDVGTLFHEATHQLFSESRPTSKTVGRQNNFWVIEGVACYMESLTDSPTSVSVGALDAGRLPPARKRLLEDKFYVPLSELTALGMEDMQRRTDLPKLYSQSAGLATFLLHAQEGRYREALVAYLRSVYDGRADSNTLAKLTGKSYDQLDAEYRAWMESLDDGKPSGSKQ